MKGLKTLFGSAVLLAGLALAPPAHAQITIGINIGTPPPVCPYGYFEYPPYRCAPYGFYGPGYFYNGIFLGVGPWAGWGYAHGWGSHRFVDARGGRYHGRAGYYANHGHFVHGYDDRGHGAPHGGGHPAPANHGAGHMNNAHRGAAAHGGHPGAASHEARAHGNAKAHSGDKPHDHN